MQGKTEIELKAENGAKEETGTKAETGTKVGTAVKADQKAGNRIYAAIDLKSFYASVECVERGLDPLKTNLVVADASRTQKTICLAVSPSLKAYGIPGRPRLFEVVQRVERINAERRRKLQGGQFSGTSADDTMLRADPSLGLSFITAPPRMAYYMQYSTRIYDIYLKYIAPEDMHVYSIDEVFLDLTDYLQTYRLSARELVMKILKDVLDQTGITATAGIGTNLYLCKIAMDIEAKHSEPDAHGARIAELDEITYRRNLWTHRPLTDFWRVGKGYAGKLAQHGMYTMGDVARCSIGGESDYYNEDLLYRLFGVNAELLIDHAWGWEPCTIADIKAYKPESNSISSGQVLKEPYSAEKARLVAREMTDLLVLDLVEKGLVTDQMVLTVGYDIENLTRPEIRNAYRGAVTTDAYGRKVPKAAHGTINLARQTSSTRLITDAVMELYDRIVDTRLLVRRMYVVANRVVSERQAAQTAQDTYEQMELFRDYEAEQKKREQEEQQLQRERNMQKAVIDIKKKYGKNAILKGMNLQEGATTIERNGQIGGHKS